MNVNYENKINGNAEKKLKERENKYTEIRKKLKNM